MNQIKKRLTRDLLYSLVQATYSHGQPNQSILRFALQQKCCTPH